MDFIFLFTIVIEEEIASYEAVAGMTRAGNGGHIEIKKR